MMGYEYDDFIWSAEKTIETCLANDFTFPKLLLITSGYSGNSLERTFDNYQMLWIEGAFTQIRINGYDAKECEISIPKWYMHKFNSSRQRKPQFLFEILREEKLPCKVFPAENWIGSELHSDSLKLTDNLSEISLIKETEDTFFYGIPLQEMDLSVADMITLPPYIRLTFKVALRFKNINRNIDVFLNKVKLKLKNWARPDPTILQDIVFQLKQGLSTTPIIVSIKNPKKGKKATKSRRPLPPIPTPVIDCPPLPTPKSIGRVESARSPSSKEQYYIDEVPSEIGPNRISLEKGLTPERNTYTCLPHHGNSPSARCETKKVDKFSSVISAQQLELTKIQSRLPTPIPCSEQVPLSRVGKVEGLAAGFETSFRVDMLSRSNESGHTSGISPKPYPRVKSKTDLDRPDTKAVCHEEKTFDVRTFSINEVSSYLEKLYLQKYIPIFQKDRVDGMILHALDEEIMINEFKMRRIETLRLLQFIKTGHIPQKKYNEPASFTPEREGERERFSYC